MTKRLGRSERLARTAVLFVQGGGGSWSYIVDYGGGFNGEYALCGNFVPIRNRWLRNTDAPGEFGDAADGLDRCAQSRITHRENRSEVSPHPLEKRSKG